MRYSAWLALGPGDLQGCALSDISNNGARIDVDNAKKLPDEFMLFLSNNGSARRACHVVWRKPRQVGVKFQTRLARADRASLVPEPDDEPAVAESAPAERAKAD
jgi:PilZ domain